MALSAVIGLSKNMLFILPVTIICAVFLLKGGNKRISGDAALAILSVGALGIGYLLMNMFSTSSNVSGDVCTTLFGSTSILTLKPYEVGLSIALSVIVIFIFIFFYNKIFALTFDENFATATGTKTEVYNLLIAILTAVIIVLAMNLVGSLLISALIIFPSLSAMRVCKNFLQVTIVSAILSVICSFFGIIVSIVIGTPVGSTIVLINIIVFVLFYIIGLVKGRLV